ncbi:MAG: preprotein translocase subunit SecY [bacterium]
MENFFHKIGVIVKDKNLRSKFLFTIIALIVFRAFAAIPIPGIDIARLQQFLSNNQFFGLLDVFSGGGLSSLSIVMLGVGPYITGSIIMQLLTMMSPKLKALYHEEGEAGRKRFTQYSRMLTVPLALIQSIGFILLLRNQGVLNAMTPFNLGVNVIIVSAGSVLLMWIGELITEFGIGNGVSLIIFSGIVARIPSAINELALNYDASQIPMIIAFFIGALVVIGGVVFITEAERPVPVTYAKRVRGNKVYGGISTYLPLRINQAGVIPIIFALSILVFPQMIAQFLVTSGNVALHAVAQAVISALQNQLVYGALYFFFVFVFTYFYTAVTFEPDSIATNLQKNGAFIPGVRPGVPTSEYLANIITRITLVGALFLGAIAVLPLILRAVTGVASLTIGGTALLIVVSVVIDLIKKVEAQLTMREY